MKRGAGKINTNKTAVIFLTLFFGILGAVFVYNDNIVSALRCDTFDCDDESAYGTVYGYKWYDYDADGVLDEDDDIEEPHLEGWTIYLVDSNGEVVETTETDNNGYYEFEEVEQDVYVICERINYDDDGGWSETYPKEGVERAVSCDGEGQAPFGYSVSVSEEEEYGPFGFGNTFALGSIRAFKFNDRENDYSYEGSESLLPGWNLCIYPDSIDESFFSNLWNFFFGEFEGGENCQITDQTGNVLWNNLPPGWYQVWENMTWEQEDEGWMQTVAPEDEEEGEGWVHLYVDEDATAGFGNHLPEFRIAVFKFWDKDDSGSRDDGEPMLEGWKICLYRGEGEDRELAGQCQDTDSDGKATWSNLAPGEYTISETDELEERNEAGEIWTSTNDNYDKGEWTVQLEGEGGEVGIELGNTTQSIHARKLFFSNEESENTPIKDWEICLYRAGGGELFPVGENSCRKTDADGWVGWTELSMGVDYVVSEERELDSRPGWTVVGKRRGPSENVYFEDWGETREITFVNRVQDRNPPESSFSNLQEHNVIDTEMLSLDLKGISIDQPLVLAGEGSDSGVSGVHEVKFSWWQIGGHEAVENYPAQSFFDVFHRVGCRDLPKGDIQTEMLSLNLVSVNPFVVSWSRNWIPESEGIFCFQVSAADYAGNQENTAVSVLAYVKTPKISEESTQEVGETSFVLNWTTEHPATSRVIYDTVSHEELGEAPNYGYAFSTEEEDLDPKTIEHSVTVSGLAQGTTYYYRTVSVGSPASVGPQGTVTTSSPPPPPPPPSSGGGSSGGGGGLPAEAFSSPIPPEGGFKVIINGDASETNSREVILTLNGGPNTVKMAISNFADFRAAAQEPYQKTKAWTLTEGEGVKTVYAKFYTQYGQASAVVSDEIIYKEAAVVLTGSATGIPVLAQNIPIFESTVPSSNTEVQQNENTNEDVQEQETTAQNIPVLETAALPGKAPQKPPAAGLLASIFDAFTFGTNLTQLGWLSIVVLLSLISWAGYMLLKRRKRG